jgi:hypothetical protein
VDGAFAAPRAGRPGADAQWFLPGQQAQHRSQGAELSAPPPPGVQGRAGR